VEPTPTVVQGTPTATPPTLSEPDVAALVAPSVVKITTGSGSASGVRTRHGILTNEHVVEGVTRVEITRSDGTQRTATVVRSDPFYDLALLATELEIPALELEPARAQRQGDPLLAMGFPFANVLAGPPSVSRGLLSAVREIDGVVFVQTDAALNFGSSGGAIVNLRGRLVGLASSGLGFGGINFGVATESIEGFLAGVVLVGPDAAEPDDVLEQARPLEIGAPAQARSFHRPGDVDWVSLDLEEGESVALFTSSPSCDTYLFLLAPDGITILDEDDDSGGIVSSRIEFTASEAGTYYGRISHFEPRGVCRAYTVAARPIPPPDSEGATGDGPRVGPAMRSQGPASVPCGRRCFTPPRLTPIQAAALVAVW